MSNNSEKSVCVNFQQLYEIIKHLSKTIKDKQVPLILVDSHDNFFSLKSVRSYTDFCKEYPLFIALHFEDIDSENPVDSGKNDPEEMIHLEVDNNYQILKEQNKELNDLVQQLKSQVVLYESHIDQLLDQLKGQVS